MINLRDFILSTYLGDDKYGNPIVDKVYIPSYSDIMNLPKGKRFTSITDFAISNTASNRHIQDANGNKIVVGKQILRTENKNLTKSEIEDCWDEGYFNINFANSIPNFSYMYCMRPSLRLDAKMLAATKKASDYFPIKEYNDENGNAICYTITFGKYPQERIKDDFVTEHELAWSLEYLFNQYKLPITGKSYAVGVLLNEKKIKSCPEFEYKGKKYIRNIATPQHALSKFNDGTAVKSEKPVWFEIKPIEWKINNWDKLPKSINPKGTGEDDFCSVTSTKGLVAGFLLNANYDPNGSPWGNSGYRFYLNGGNPLSKEYNPNGKRPETEFNKLYNFEGRGFIDSALDMDLTIDFTKDISNQEELDSTL